MYATSIRPDDGSTPEAVSNACFRGEKELAELSHVLALHRANSQDAFERVDADEWFIQRPAPFELVELDTLLIEARRLRDDVWELVASWDGSEWTDSLGRPA